MVLVSKSKNNHKQDNYPIEADIQNKMHGIWKSLREKNLITEEKYYRLTRNSTFTDDEKSRFIARQMVETSQATKGVTDLLKELVAPQGTQIVYAKAANVSRFRQEYGFIKSRVVNDFHHAQDAYLNIVVGNAYYVKFTQNPINFICKDYNQDVKKNNYNLSKMFEGEIRRGNEIAWIPASSKETKETEGTILAVKKVMEKNTPILSRMTFTGHGGLANETLYSAKAAKSDNYIPLKSNDPKMDDVTRYGGFTSISTAYFVLVEHDKGKKRIRTIETVPIYLADRIEKKPELLEDYLRVDLKLKNASVRIRKIKLQSLINRNGYCAHITGATGNQYYLRNAMGMCLKQSWVTYIKKMEKAKECGVCDSLITKEKNQELYSILEDKHLHMVYAKRPNPVGEKLEKAKGVFAQLEIQKQVLVLLEILQITAIGQPKADLTGINESKSTGVMLMGKNITDTDELYLINQSVTGLYQKQINLLTV